MEEPCLALPQSDASSPTKARALVLARTEVGGGVEGIEEGNVAQELADGHDDLGRLKRRLQGGRRRHDAGQPLVLRVEGGERQRVQAAEAVAKHELRYALHGGIIPHGARIGHDVVVVARVTAGAARAATAALVVADDLDAGLGEQWEDMVVAANVFAKAGTRSGKAEGMSTVGSTPAARACGFGPHPWKARTTATGFSHASGCHTLT